MSPDEDGINHINVYSKAKTELGRFLSNFSDCNVATLDGPFKTIEGYWYWLNLPEGTPEREKLRITNGFDSKFLGRDLKAPDWGPKKFDLDFERKICYAITVKILSNRWCCLELIKSQGKPLFHYYVYGTKVIMVKDGLWMLRLMEQIRDELINGVIPIPD